MVIRPTDRATQSIGSNVGWLGGDQMLRAGIVGTVIVSTMTVGTMAIGTMAIGTMLMVAIDASRLPAQAQVQASVGAIESYPMEKMILANTPDRPASAPSQPEPSQPELSQPEPSRPDAPPEDAPSDSPDAEPTMGTVSGQITYLQRIALPPDAVVEVKLQEVSRLDAPAVTIAEQTFPTEGRQVPIPFELSYDTSQIEPHLTYVVRVRILVEGETRWINASADRVLTRGGGSEVEVQVVPVASNRGNLPR